MGANAGTAVPVYASGQVLTAANLNLTNCGVPVFSGTATRDAAFGGSGEKVLAEGQLAYLEDIDKVQFYNGSSWANLGSVTNVAAFTASGTWTVPAGVTYAIAHIRAGGGGVGTASAGTGGTSSVAFAGGTISASGGIGHTTNIAVVSTRAGAANSGQGAVQASFSSSIAGEYREDKSPGSIQGGDGAEIVAGGAVTPAASITVTVGAGGTAGTNGAAGGSGYVWIEYQV